MKLYWFSGCPPCWRVLIFLKEKKIDYESIPIDLFQREHQTEEFRKINPRQSVPVLIDGDVSLTESIAACLYLEKTYGGRRVLSDDNNMYGIILDRAMEALNVSQLTADITHYTQYWFVGTEYEVKVDEKVLQPMVDKLKSELDLWENYLKIQQNNHDSEYLIGSEFTMADVVFFPQLAILVWHHLELDDQRYPALKRYYDFVKKVKSVEDSWPPSWKVAMPRCPHPVFTVAPEQK